VKILAIDTATENCSAALFINGQLSMREALLGRGHAERILPMVQELLRAADVALRALSAVAFGRGPARSLASAPRREGVTQGLALGAGLPVVPISDLRALAQRVFDDEPAADRVLICNDARMHEVYSGTFERGPRGRAAGRGGRGARGQARARAAAAAMVRSGRRGAVCRRQWPRRLSAAARDVAAVVRSGICEGSGRGPPRSRRLAAPEVEAGRCVHGRRGPPVYLRDNVAQCRGTSSH
jgi:tRNA threonylcarbamoyladenosine biosynthesis protein TsaB